MAIFNGMNLKEWRKSLKISAQDLADSVPCDVTTIFRYESGKMTPDPNQMLRICRILGDETKWYDWMQTVWSSCQEMYPETGRNDLSGSILRLYAALEELGDSRRNVFVDAADGSIDSEMLRRKLRGLTNELLSVSQTLRAMLPDAKGGAR